MLRTVNPIMPDPLSGGGNAVCFYRHREHVRHRPINLLKNEKEKEKETSAAIATTATHPQLLPPPFTLAR